MAILLTFKNVCLYKDEPYGINRVSFEIERGRRYRIATQNEEQLNVLCGLMEGRFQKKSGLIERSDQLFLQSDRLLLGDKVYSRTVSEWLLLTNEFFLFGGKRRSKYGFIQTIRAKHLLDYPIYKLRGSDKVKFALLSLAFQERGIILISRLLTLKLDDALVDFLQRIIDQTHTTCCLLTDPVNHSATVRFEKEEMTTILLNTAESLHQPD